MSTSDELSGAEEASSTLSSTSTSEGEGSSKLRTPPTCKDRLLLGHRKIYIVVVSAGLAQASAAVCQTFVLGPLQGELWGKDMAQLGAWFGIVINIVAFLTGGSFGRLSDKIDRRVACCAFFVGSFLPAISLVVMGLTNRGLWVACASRILGAVVVAANVPMALLQDVSPFEHREVATGIFFALTNGLTVLLNGVPAVLITILKVVNIGAFEMLLFSLILAGLALVGLAMLGSVRTDPDRPSESRTHAEDPDRRGGCRAAFLDPLILIWKHSRLRPLCASAFLMSWAGTIIMCTSGQYYNDALGLLPYGLPSEFAMVSVLQTLPGQLLVIPGYWITGSLSKSKGSLFLLRILIPITALLMLPGIVMAFAPFMWILPVVVIALNYTGLPQVPLFRMIAGVAPPGRMGEALSAAGITMQAAGLVSNLMIALTSSRVQNIPMKSPLWVFYPLAAVLQFCAVLPLLGNPRHGHWGAAAGVVEDQVMATIYAAVFGLRWLRKSQERSPHLQEASSSTEASADETNAAEARV